MNPNRHFLFFFVCLAWLLFSPARPLVAQNTANNATLSGYVMDMESKETIVSAVVSIKAAKLGTFTNKSGFFALKNIPSGTYTVTVSYLGYAKKEVELTFQAGESKKLTAELKRSIKQSEQVNVEATREAEKRQINISQVSVQMEQVKQLRIGGESDVFRTIQYLPGVLTASQVSSGLYIRGGSPDQNLVLLDGMTVYNPSHLFGFISSFNTDAIKDVDLNRGGFGPEYGGRLSAVVNLTQKEGNREKVAGSAALGIISSKAFVEGPLGNGAFMVSARRTYLDAILALLPKDPLNPLPDFAFYDLNAKITQNITPDDKISLSGFLSRDYLKLGASGISIGIGIGNRSASARWTHVFGDNLFSTLNLSASRYNNGFDGNNSGFEFFVDNTITDYTGKLDLEWFASSDLTVKFGAEVTNFRFTYEQNFSGSRDSIAQIGTQTSTQTNLAITDWTYAAYGQFNYQLSDKMSVQTGLRGYYFRQNNSVALDPRLSFRYQFNDDITVKAAWGLYHQYLRLASNPNFSFFDTWLPTDSSLGLSSALHYILSLETKPVEGYSLNFDLYYKTLNNINEINLSNIRSRNVSQIFYSGNGYSYGAEVFLEKKTGDLTGWIGYAMGWVWSTFDSLNGGRRFNTRYDRRHDFKAVALYRLNDRWEIGGSFIFQSGQPFTGVSSRFQTFLPNELFGTGVTIPTDRNGLRLPPSHQLNLNVNYNTTLFDLPARLLIDIYNVYSRRDILFRYYDTSDKTTVPTDVRLLPILPTLSLEVKF